MAAKAIRIRRKRVSLTDEKNDQTGFFDGFVFFLQRFVSAF